MKTIQGKKNSCKKVFVNVTQNCNYHCKYCEFPVIKNKAIMPEDVFERIVLSLNSSNVLPVITGGEPTIYKHLDKINLFTIPFSIYSNLSQDISFYENLNCSIFTSFHRSMVPNVEDFVWKVNNLNIENVHVMLEEDDFDFYNTLFSNIRKPAYLIPIRSKFYNGIDINEGFYNFDIEKYKKFPMFHINVGDKTFSEFEFLKWKFSNLRSCNILKYKRIIYENGDVFGCQYLPKMGDVNEIENLIEIDKNIMCKEKTCSACNMRIGTKVEF